jgi:hypothetical protein
MGAISVTFDRVLRTANDSVSGIKLSIDESPVAYKTISNFCPVKSINMNDFHKMLGRCGSDRCRRLLRSTV